MLSCTVIELEVFSLKKTAQQLIVPLQILVSDRAALGLKGKGHGLATLRPKSTSLRMSSGRRSGCGGLLTEPPDLPPSFGAGPMAMHPKTPLSDSLAARFGCV